MEWSQTFEFSMPIDRVWEAFNDRSTPAPWNHVFTGDPYFGRGSITVTEGARQDEGPERSLTWSETEGTDTVQMTVTCVSTATGARITLTRFGFGDDPLLLNRSGGRFLGWVESMYDFALFLQYGVRRARHFGTGDGFRRLGLLGVEMVDTAAGVVAGRVNDGLARTAGMVSGDLFLAAQGAHVFSRSDLWLVQRMLSPGTSLELTYLHDGEVRSGRAVVPAG